VVGRGGMCASTDNTGDLQSLELTRAQPTRKFAFDQSSNTFRDTIAMLRTQGERRAAIKRATSPQSRDRGVPRDACLNQRCQRTLHVAVEFRRCRRVSM